MWSPIMWLAAVAHLTIIDVDTFLVSNRKLWKERPQNIRDIKWTPALKPALKEHYCFDPRQVVIDIAYKKQAFQSSTYYSANDVRGVAQRAVDGNPSIIMTKQRAVDGNPSRMMTIELCAHTQKDIRPWWAVYLRHRYFVTSVTITNVESEAYWHRLSNIQVGTSLNNPPVNGSTIEYDACAFREAVVPRGDSHTFYCNQGGRSVVVQLLKEEYLMLCQVEVYGYIERNFALGLFGKIGDAAQSSTFHEYFSHLAVDGTRWSCTHTEEAAFNWWMVDLGRQYWLDVVEITNKQGFYGRRLNNFTIAVVHYADVNDTFEMTVRKARVCATGDRIPPAKTRAFSCNQAGKAVVIYMDHKDTGVLTLCEVEVYGHDPLMELENVACAKPAYQSSTNQRYMAKNAVDGAYWKLVLESNSCAHTRKEKNPWWAVNLLNTYIIQSVAVTTRSGCCAERLSSIVLGVSFTNPNEKRPTRNNTVVCTNEKGTPLEEGETSSFYCAALGRYVVVFLETSEVEYLTLCEVEVAGAAYGNVALNKKAYQSSTHPYKARNDMHFDGEARNAVDGIPATVTTISCTHTNEDQDPWWAVDLRYRYYIKEINFTNRLDCCADRLSSLRLGMTDQILAFENFSTVNEPMYPCALSLFEHEPGETINLKCEIYGQYFVIVMTKKGYLSLCEVELFGYLVTEINIALKKKAYQSSTLPYTQQNIFMHFDGEARNAVDGSLFPCTHTNEEQDPWWAVDLKYRYYIKAIKIREINRLNNSPDRLLHLGITDQNPAGENFSTVNEPMYPCALSLFEHQHEPTINLKCEKSGQYFVIVMRKKGYLSLCNVELFGYLAFPPVVRFQPQSQGQSSGSSEKTAAGVASSSAVIGTVVATVIAVGLAGLMGTLYMRKKTKGSHGKEAPPPQHD